MEFVGMTVLVTGGASGIGKATVMQLVRENASVICADIDQTKSKALVEEGKASGSAITLSVARGAAEPGEFALAVRGQNLVKHQLKAAFDITLQ